MLNKPAHIEKVTELCPSKSDGHRGFTLVELLTVIAIMSLLVGVAVGSFVPMIDRSRASETMNLLRTDLVFARGQAIKFGGWVQICGTDDNYQCTDSFDDGWMVYLDIDNDYTYTSSEDELLTVNIGIHNTLDVNVSDVSTAVDTPLTLNHRGYPDRAVFFQVMKDEAIYEIVLNTTGNIELL